MRRLVILLLALLPALAARADEGMWMVGLIDSALHKNMVARGLELGANVIYNADAPGTALTDAIVSLDFECTGSMISDNGLLITNHHCAYNDVYKMSSLEKNYLEDGFWAMTADQEVVIPGKKVLFLKRVIDVTDEVNALRQELELEGRPVSSRRLAYLFETKYSEEYDLEAELASMWAGTKYYISLYEVYSDVRLVAAPPVSISAFGGDIDNWEWPQHKCDFALYRIYAASDGSPAEYSPENIPLRPEKTLKISTDGYKPGDFTMVIGYPGGTDRYSGSAKTLFLQDLALPILTEAGSRQMEIINGWMNTDPEVRLKYSDYYFDLSNAQELEEGERLCIKRFDVVGEKRSIEAGMQEWIDASALRQERWGNLLDDLREKYIAQTESQNNIYWYRETLVRGTQFGLAALRLHSGSHLTPEQAEEMYNAMDLRVEKDLLRYCIEAYYTHVCSSGLGRFQESLLEQFRDPASEKVDYDAMTAYLWENSCYLSDIANLMHLLARSYDNEDLEEDLLCRFFLDVGARSFNEEIHQAQGSPDISTLEKEYTHVLYQMWQDMGVAQYPDANSTMRLTYGRVNDLSPYDGVHLSWRTSTAGILEKYDPQKYDFTLDPKQKSLLETAEWGKWGDKGILPVNFLTDNDITGGNSGSPVLNSRGELIGLAFDGNKESLSGDVFYTPDYNRCVCVDIRYVLWVLDRYAGMTRILQELNL